MFDIADKKVERYSSFDSFLKNRAVTKRAKLDCPSVYFEGIENTRQCRPPLISLKFARENDRGEMMRVSVRYRI